MSHGQKHEYSWYSQVLFVVVLVVLSPLIVLLAGILFAPWLKARYIDRPRLLRRVKKEWLPQGKNILFIYSDNPEWKEYVMQHIVPHIKDRAIFLNWSEKNKWISTPALEVELFKNFNWGKTVLSRRRTRSGGQEYNHQAIVFRPWNKPKIISFWKGFKQAQFGKPDLLRQNTKQLLDEASQ